MIRRASLTSHICFAVTTAVLGYITVVEAVDGSWLALNYALVAAIVVAVWLYEIRDARLYPDFQGPTREVEVGELRQGQTVVAVAGTELRPQRGGVWPTVVDVEPDWHDEPVWALVLSDNPARTAYFLDLDEKVTVAA